MKYAKIAVHEPTVWYLEWDESLTMYLFHSYSLFAFWTDMSRELLPFLVLEEGNFRIYGPYLRLSVVLWPPFETFFNFVPSNRGLNCAPSFANEASRIIKCWLLSPKRGTTNKLNHGSEREQKEAHSDAPKVKTPQNSFSGFSELWEMEMRQETRRQQQKHHSHATANNENGSFPSSESGSMPYLLFSACRKCENIRNPEKKSPSKNRTCARATRNSLTWTVTFRCVPRRRRTIIFIFERPRKLCLPRSEPWLFLRGNKKEELELSFPLNGRQLIDG